MRVWIPYFYSCTFIQRKTRFLFEKDLFKKKDLFETGRCEKCLLKRKRQQILLENGIFGKPKKF